MYQALYFRTWFMFPTIVLCGGGEIAAWVAPVWASKNGSWSLPMFLMQYAFAFDSLMLEPNPVNLLKIFDYHHRPDIHGGRQLYYPRKDHISLRAPI
jgi:hypothetical protein